MTFDEHGSLVTLEVSTKNDRVTVVRGEPLPGAPVEVLFTKAGNSSSYSLGMRGGALFEVTNGSLVRHDGSNGQPSVVTTLDTGVGQFVVDGSELFYQGRNDALYRIGFDGTGKVQVDTGAPGGKSALTADAVDRYFVGISPPKLYRASKPAGTPVLLPASNVPKYVSALHVSSTHIVGRSYQGSSVSCASFSWVLWSMPKTGGAATVLASGLGAPGREWVVGNEVFWEEPECAGSAYSGRIVRKKVDGTGPSTQVVDLGPGGATEGLEIQGAWLYWSDRKGTVFRIPR